MNLKQLEKSFDEEFPPSYFKKQTGYYSERYGFKQSSALKSFFKQSLIFLLEENVERLRGNKRKDDCGENCTPNCGFNFAIDQEILYYQSIISELSK